ncbi:hypothetical protein [Paenibacillus sp. NPDC057967]|uniref:hypothetical protein n=1 Tax=Paenibacillus sp. NPDC057967 TaxID=3346293 RepID=UPI0036DAB38F
MSIFITPDVTDKDLHDEVTETMESDASKKIETMDDAMRYAYSLSETRKDIKEINRLENDENHNSAGNVVTVDGETLNFLKAVHQERKFEVK